MNYLMYYVPNVGVISNENKDKVLKDTPLLDVFGDSNSFTCREISSGPTIKDAKKPTAKGMIFVCLPPHVSADKETKINLKYDKNNQRWEHIYINDEYKYSVGYWIDKIPGPDDLMRSGAINGYSVESTDGNKWTIPLARLLNGDSLLPQSLKLDSKTKELILKPLTKYEKLCGYALEYFEKLKEVYDNNKIDREESYPHLFEIAECALSTNYHVSAHEISLLEIVDTTNVIMICGMICDLPNIIKQHLESQGDQTLGEEIKTDTDSNT